MANEIKIVISGDDKASAVLKAFERSFGGMTKELQSQGKKTARTMDDLGLTLNKLEKRFFNLKSLMIGGIAGIGLKSIATHALDTAASFERMEIQLNKLTGGRGKQTLDELNAWAIEMPVNTQKTVEAFVMMKSYGLDPNLKTMETLVDVASIFGEEAMPRVARALGQIQARGALSAQELNQLSEAGINARKYLTEAFSMTAEEIQAAGISVDKVIKAIMQGLERDFGGAARESMRTWQGLTSTFESYVVEIERQIMAGGVFDALKDALSDVNKELASWIENNSLVIEEKVPEYVEKVKNVLEKIYNMLTYDPAIMEWGLIGLAIGGKKLGVLAASVGHLATWAENLGKALGMVAGGVLDISDVARADFAELEALVAEGERIMEGRQVVRRRIIMPPKAAEGKPAPEETPEIVNKKALEKQAKDEMKWLEEISKKAAEESEDAWSMMAYEMGVSDEQMKVYREREKLAKESADKEREAWTALMVQEENDIQDFMKQWEASAKKRMSVSDKLYEGMIDGLEEVEEHATDVYDAMFNTTRDFAENSKWTLSEFFFDAMSNDLKSFGDYWEAFWTRMKNSLARTFADMATEWAMSGIKDILTKGGGGSLLGTVAGAAGSLWSGITSAGSWIASLFHEGGIVGKGGEQMVLAPNELLAILQKGERVLTREEAALFERYLGGGAAGAAMGPTPGIAGAPNAGMTVGQAVGLMGLGLAVPSMGASLAAAAAGSIPAALSAIFGFARGYSLVSGIEQGFSVAEANAMQQSMDILGGGLNAGMTHGMSIAEAMGILAGMGADAGGGGSYGGAGFGGGADAYGGPGYATGGIVPRDQVAKVHRGEGVFTPEQMKYLSVNRQAKINFTAPIYLDGNLISTYRGEALYDSSKRGMVTLHPRAIEGYYDTVGLDV